MLNNYCLAMRKKCLAKGHKHSAFSDFSILPLSHCAPIICYVKKNNNLSHDVMSGSEITPCNKIDKPQVVYRFSGNVMTSIITSHTYSNDTVIKFNGRNEMSK